MSKRTISITKFDKIRLEKLLAATREGNFRGRDDLKELSEEMARARSIDPKEVPSNVVTMNSRVRLLDLDTDEISEYTLVFPQEANVDAGKISIMSPIGTAILGYCVGDTIEWTVPAGKTRLRIEHLLYQPEAAGDYHL